MNAVDKVIFNALATRQGVALPDVGTLKVVRKPAQLSGKSQLNVPINCIEFSSKQDLTLTSIIAFISTEADVDAQQATSIYEKWLAGARHDSVVGIDGVGDIRKNIFKPSKELDSLLNPFGTETVTLASQSKPWVWVAVLLPLAILTGGIYYSLYVSPYWWEGAFSGNNIEVEVAQSTMLPTPATTPAPIVEDTVQTAQIASDTATQTISKPQTGITYHVVIGVFSTVENADKCIAQAREKESSLPLTKVPFPGGKILVSIYSSQNEDIAQQYKTKLSTLSPDLWLYKQVIK